MFDPTLIPAINANVASGLDAIGSKKDNINRAQLSDAYVLLHYGVLKWQGDGHAAQNVLQQVNQDPKGNMDRHNAAAAAAAMKASPPTLAIVVG